MATLTIRNATNKIQLVGLSTGVYLMADYEMGSPVPNDGSVVKEGSMQNGICIDTITLNVVGKTKDGVSKLVSKLYRSLSDAASYWKGGYPYPVYLEAQVTGYATPLYATIVDFQFHALPDSFDEVNGKILQNVTIVLTRGVWAELPPQDLFYAFRDGNYTKKVYPDIYWDNFYMIDLGTPWNPELIYKLETSYRLPQSARTTGIRTVVGRADQFDHAIFLSSSDRGALLDWVANEVDSAENVGDADYVGPPILFRDETDGEILYLRFTNRGNGIVYETTHSEPITAVDSPADIDVYAQTGSSAWTEFSTGAYSVESGASPLSYKDKQTIHTWNSDSPALMTSWIKGLGGGVGPLGDPIPDSAYWLKLIAEPAGASLTILGDITAGENWPYIPTRPWLDIDGHNGALPMPLRMAIKSFNNPSVSSYDAFLRSAIHMNRLIIATGYGDTHTATNSWDVTPPDTLPMGFYNYTDDPFGVFPEYSCISLSGSYPFADGSAAPSGRSIDCQIGSGDLNSGTFFKVAQHTIPWGGGLFRAFIRLRLVGEPGVGDSFAHFRISVKRTSSSVYDTRETATISAVGTLDATSDYTHSDTGTPSYNYINMVDLGVIRLGSPRTSPDEEVLYYVTTEVSVSGDWSPDMRLHDLILLPVNDNFTFVSGDTTPNYLSLSPADLDPPQTDYTIPSLEPYRRNQRGLYIDGFAPNGIRAGIANTPVPQGAFFEKTAANSLIWEDRFLYEWSVNSSGTFALRPGTKNRFYFLFYKAAPDGTLLSSHDMVYSVTPFGIKNYVTLPGVY